MRREMEEQLAARHAGNLGSSLQRSAELLRHPMRLACHMLLGWSVRWSFLRVVLTHVIGHDVFNVLTRSLWSGIARSLYRNTQ